MLDLLEMTCFMPAGVSGASFNLDDFRSQIRRGVWEEDAAEGNENSRVADEQ